MSLYSLAQNLTHSEKDGAAKYLYQEPVLYFRTLKSVYMMSASLRVNNPFTATSRSFSGIDLKPGRLHDRASTAAQPGWGSPVIRLALSTAPFLVVLTGWLLAGYTLVASLFPTFYCGPKLSDVTHMVLYLWAAIAAFTAENPRVHRVIARFAIDLSLWGVTYLLLFPRSSSKRQPRR
ncbi:hypothetical protein SAICODRAFT_131047 [Saitoella complicata NRRL Y-17804]|uniref:uncharacterized protein n=1 Tax=Saitoella complicata (strain BCRC 22490 / CBS 7301 / JCM 7358 / NBRC 10748 / NRRL Y-17804) TaxID=698492 RepID=UPI000866E1F6|nr:uncharacterized protein SAICODRAFT_131047 [Saitoella complicata NRRL Y-17804]ODQ52588.1 hypothetical protein SAICODRAFT_131047 [Saitoella complicata NRRL Y-17804]